MKKCTVIIVNYNTGEIIRSAYQAVLKNPKVKEIIVVDNASQDNSMDLLIDDKRLTKYFRKENHGFASSCNFGSQYVASEYMLFLNPDCIIKENTITTLIEDLEEDSSAAIVSCMINNPDGGEQRAARRRLPTLLRAIKTFTKIEKLAKWFHCFAGVNLNHLPLKKYTYEVEAISGALILMRTSLFKEIKGFDESFPLHFEDLDLFKRTKDHGYKILLNPSVNVVHHQGTSSQSNPKVEQYKRKGLERYFQKHCSVLAYKVVKILNKIRK
ncbi:MAG: glycosyltransferase family 2 protein [Alcanivoracaceae bacterium]|nr:glycosyltransferase family 2 protein [Alcanivoracaceae bacterium]